MASGGDAGDPRVRPAHTRLLGPSVTSSAAVRAHRTPVAPGSATPRSSGYDLLEGELAFIHGDYAAAARWMAPAIQQIHEMGGGSREQKDIFRDIFLELQRRLGHTDQVIELAEQRLRANPRHIPSLTALAWA